MYVRGMRKHATLALIGVFPPRYRAFHRDRGVLPRDYIISREIDHAERDIKSLPLAEYSYT